MGQQDEQGTSLSAIVRKTPENPDCGRPAGLPPVQTHTERRRCAETQGEAAVSGGGRRTDVATSQGTRNPREGLSLEPLEGARPCDILSWDVWPQNRDSKTLWFLAAAEGILLQRGWGFCSRCPGDFWRRSSWEVAELGFEPGHQGGARAAESRATRLALQVSLSARLLSPGSEPRDQDPRASWAPLCPQPCPLKNHTAGDQSTRNLLNAPLFQCATNHTHGSGGPQPGSCGPGQVTSRRTSQSNEPELGWRESQEGEVERGMRADASGWKSQPLE